MRIITGRAGTGKTNQILREIAVCSEQNLGRQFLIVPELYSHQYERRLSETTENMGARTAEVLTFSRMCDRVFAEVGGLSEQSLDAAGQLLTLRRAVLSVQAGLKTFAGLGEKTQMLREVLGMVEECKHYGVKPADMFASLSEIDDTGLSEKLSDFAQIYTAYDRLCEEGLPDPRDRLTKLAEEMPKSELFTQASVYFDGFYGFTGQEYAVIGEILKKNQDVTFAVLYDRADADSFPSGSKTLEHLRRLARKENAIIEFVALCEEQIQYPAAIRALERQILQPIHTPEETQSEGLCVYEALSPFEECEHVAASIQRMVRSGGYRYREIIVAARDMTTYSAFLSMAMERFEIPFFYAEKEDLLQKPPFLFLLHAVRAAIGGFAYEDVFTSLKTGLTPLTDNEVDALENYVLTWRIRGNTWLMPWDMNPDGYSAKETPKTKQTLAYLNELRARIAKPFGALKEGFMGRETVGEFVRTMYAFLCEMEMPQQMLARANSLEAAGDLQRAEEYRQLWDILVSAMEQFSWISDEQTITGEEFAALFTMALGEYDVGTIPVSIDRVTCGEIDRVCGEHKKAVFLLGVSEGVLPKASGGETLFSEYERDLMELAGISLKETGIDAIQMEQELVYRIVTCPTDVLQISYPLADASGGEIRPSHLIASIRNIVRGIKRESYLACREADRLQAESPCVELACAYVSGSRSPAARAAYLRYAEDARVKRAALQKRGRENIQNRKVLGELYGKKIGVTPTRVDVFYSCEFAYFMQYGLSAKKRKTAKFDALEVGNFLHYVLENGLLMLGQREGGAMAADSAEIRAVCREVVQRYTEEEIGGMENKSARFRYIFRRLVAMAEEILQNVVDEMRISDFEPIDFELNFAEGGDLPPVTVAGEQTEVSLSGKVDRVDGYIKGKRLYLRVMDYKSGKKSFSLSDVWYGLNMQMIIYLFALEDAGLDRYRERLSSEIDEIVPAGVLYIPARTEVVDAERSESEEKVRKEREKALRRKGLLSDDMDILEAMEKGVTEQAKYLPIKLKKGEEPTLNEAVSAVASLERFGKLARFAQKKLLQMGEEISMGTIKANPIQRDKNTKHCDYCDFRAACHFDDAMGDKMHAIKALKGEEFWESLSEEEVHNAKMDK